MGPCLSANPAARAGCAGPLAGLLAAVLLVLAGAAQAAPGTPAAPDGQKPEIQKPDARKPDAQDPGGEARAAEPIVLANHRAVYDLSLAEGGGTRSVEGARGRIVIDFRGDACRGYTMQTRQVTELSSGETGTRLSDLRSATFEGGEGREFRFRTTTVTNGGPAEPVDGTATAAEVLRVKFKGAGKGFSADGPVLFPSLHMRRLIEAARAGRTTLAAKVYDGSDDGRKVYDTFAVIGHTATGPAPAAGEARDRPLREGALAAMPRWPVTLSYYTEGTGERTPIYTLSFDLYENGVSGALKLDYGDFAILGDMTALDLAGARAGDRDPGRDAKGCTP